MSAVFGGDDPRAAELVPRAADACRRSLVHMYASKPFGSGMAIGFGVE